MDQERLELHLRGKHVQFMAIEIGLSRLIKDLIENGL
jgi:hypothetical protein